jgi:hypothetical protein
MEVYPAGLSPTPMTGGYVIVDAKKIENCGKQLAQKLIMGGDKKKKGSECCPSLRNIS